MSKSNLSLPPHGILANDYSDLANPSSAPPRDFKSGAGKLTEEQLNEKNAFVDEVVKKIKDLYWPEWLLQNSKWDGKSAVSINELTGQDLKLLVGLRFKLRDYVGLKDRVVCRTHSECFTTEDSRESPFAEFKHYCPDIKGEWLVAFPNLFQAGMDDKVGSIDLQLKVRFQRPRPYQAAFLMKDPHFTCRLATTAMHPSLIAGHCIQALFGGLNVHLIWKNETEAYATIESALEQYSTDFGDRRVLAGVHYPSDSLITWLVCFMLLPYVVIVSQQNSAKKFLQRSIKKSRVWTFVNSAVGKKQITCAVYKKLIAAVAKQLKA
jgi:hypothetical protein